MSTTAARFTAGSLHRERVAARAKAQQIDILAYCLIDWCKPLRCHKVSNSIFMVEPGAIMRFMETVRHLVGNFGAVVGVERQPVMLRNPGKLLQKRG